MGAPDVVKVQRILHGIGYLVEPSGYYDESTFRSVLKFDNRSQVLGSEVLGSGFER